jgi:hypothetical protein
MPMPPTDEQLAQLEKDIQQLVFSDHWDPIAEVFGFALAAGTSSEDFAHELVENGLQATMEKYEGPHLP